MDKAIIIKLAGLLVGSFLVTIVIMYFLYPYLNEEGYQEVVAEVKTETDSLATATNIPNEDILGVSIGENFITHRDTCIDTNNNTILLATIDSLNQVNLGYEQRIAELTEQVSAAHAASQATPIVQNNTANNPAGNVANTLSTDVNTQIEKEEFFERVKSFLNLDEEELAPIVAKLNNDELVRLYQGGGTIQREKLLRSLKPDRAASIMKEIML